MVLKNSSLLLFFSIFAVSFSAQATTLAKTEEIKPPLCDTKQGCLNRENKNCTCWCSVACSPRYKKETDVGPIWLDASDDKYGKKCYCQQRDLDLYEPNECALKEQESKSRELQETIHEIINEVYFEPNVN